MHIYGGVVVDTGNVGACPAMAFNGNPTYTSGSVSILNGGTCSGCPFTPGSFPAQVLDPFAGLTPPGDTCGSGSNPSPTNIGGVLHYPPGTYPTQLSPPSEPAVQQAGLKDLGNPASAPGPDEPAIRLIKRRCSRRQSARSRDGGQVPRIITATSLPLFGL